MALLGYKKEVDEEEEEKSKDKNKENEILFDCGERKKTHKLSDIKQIVVERYGN